MLRRTTIVSVAVLWIVSLATLATAAVFCAKNASPTERLAAKEVRRYVYLRTGRMLPIVDQLKTNEDGVIVVGIKSQSAVQALLSDAKLKAAVDGLTADQYMLKTLQHDGHPTLLIVGGDSTSTLYGAYRFAEHLGVRFYLHGDVVPDKQIAFKLPTLDETRKPLFNLRGIQPFHDFPEGPDWWSRDGYKAILGQLPKMGMNFIGLHTYSELDVGPEPLVWIGPPDEIDPNGKVKISYPSRHFTTSDATGVWGYQPGRTSDYVFGAADLFDRDDYGPDYMRDMPHWNREEMANSNMISAEQCNANAVFNRLGEFLADVFTFARHMGIKTCIGTESPLVIPTPLKQRLKAAGKNPADPAVVELIYEGMFQRIAKIHPLDYFWLWTPETWTMASVKQAQIDETVADFRAVLAAAKKVKPPFTLATCGWELGPPQSPAVFDGLLPRDMPMSCINRVVGFAPVEPGFAKIEGRPKWAIPWLEDDAGMTMPQLWVGRVRRDASDALKYGCTGLMGIHWRTRVLAPNVSALARAAWNQTGWTGEPKEAVDRAGHVTTTFGDRSQFLPVDDLYADWAIAEFGPDAAKPIAAIFSRLDGRLPRPADWVRGPGGIRPDNRPWGEVRKEYAFVDELAALRPLVDGAGNLERFDYWLNTFRYLRSIAAVRCVWRQFNAALAKASAEKDRATQKKLARELALPVRRRLVAAFAEMYGHLLATVTNPGEMGTVCNWQQQTLPVLLTAPGEELAVLLGEQLPADAMPSKNYTGMPRLFVPEVRTGIVAGETLKLTAIVLGATPDAVEVFWRPLGPGKFTSKPLKHIARGVHEVSLPADAVQSDFEYYVQATVGGKPLVFPPTAPTMNQTVVVEE